MTDAPSLRTASTTTAVPPESAPAVASSLVLSFDIEEHDRIEAVVAAGLVVAPELKAEYATRMESATRRILERLAATNTPATFYVVGQIATTHRNLVRDIAAAGHEVGSHGWDHRRVHTFTPATFAEDLRISKDVLEQTIGRPVHGYRAPTFSIVRKTAWAIDVLAESGLLYDSSIYPVRHDRYGIPDAPRSPFLAVGATGEILELPPVTYRKFGQNFPVAGGGYFRLLPLFATTGSLEQMRTTTTPAVGMMYFHPWEFDPGQPKLPLGRVSKWRTYVGIGSSMQKLDELLKRYRFRRAIDVVGLLQAGRATLPRFRVTSTTPDN